MNSFILWLCLSVVVVYVANGEKIQIPVGGIFHESHTELEITFNSAIDSVNFYEKEFELIPVIKRVLQYDGYQTEKAVCHFSSAGIGAIFGPSDILSTGIAESICSEIEIPHIIMHWTPEPLVLRSMERPHDMTINFYPEGNLLSQALADLIVDYDWTSFTIIYETDEGLMRVKDALQIKEPGNVAVAVKQLPDDGDYRPLFKELQKSSIGRIILDCDPDKMLDIFRQANDVNMMEEYQSYVIVSLNAHTIDFEEVKAFRANITTMRIFDPENDEIKILVNNIEQRQRKIDPLFRLKSEQIKTESILLYDAVKIFANSVKELVQTEEISVSPISCSKPSKWEFGKKIIQSIKDRYTVEEKKSYLGASGELLFDEDGRRVHFILEVVELSKLGFRKIGNWLPVDGILSTRDSNEVDSLIIQSLQNKTITVVTRIGPPFLDWRIPEEGEVLEGNNRFEGYSLDLIDGIANILKFNYKFELVPDNKYGSFNKETKEWDGLVRHLLDRKADLAICDLTITYERRTAVDFTMPFMTLGVSILYSKPVKQSPDLFSFLSPLSLDVWIYMATAYLGVSMLLFVLARMAPDDWESSHPCNQNPEEVENIWSIINSTWLTMGSIMGQGCDILPKAVSTRLVAGMWWFFALIMLSSYTANLAAFLTMERMDATIEGAEDLAKQSKIKYGAVEGGSTLAFFKGSNFSTYQRMWAAMESGRPSVFTKSNQEGVERVSKGKRLYAFLMESTSIEYIVERQCDLTQIGGLLDNKGYGIAMPVNSPYRTAISGAVLKMQEGGQLITMKTKWWKEMHGGGRCKEEASTSSDSAAELGIENVGGVFVVLLFGCLTGLLIGILEFLWNVKNVAIEERISLREAFMSEIKFAAQIWITTKPVRMGKTEISKTSSSKSTLNESYKTYSRRNSEKSMGTHILSGASSIHDLEKLGQQIFPKKDKK